MNLENKPSNFVLFYSLLNKAVEEIGSLSEIKSERHVQAIEKLEEKLILENAWGKEWKIL